MKKFSKLLTLALIAGIGIFGSCKDCNEDEYQDLSLQNQKLDQRLSVLEGALQSLTPQLTATIADFEKRITALENATPIIIDLSEYAKLTDLEGLAKLEDLKKYATKEELDNCATKLALETAVNTLNGDIKKINDVLANLDPEEIAKAIESMKQIGEIAGQVEGIYDIIGKDGSKFNEIVSNVEIIKENAATALTAANGAAEDAAQALILAQANQSRIETIEKAIEGIGSVKDDIKGLKGDVKTLNDKLKKLSTNINSTIKALEKDVYDQLDNININLFDINADIEEAYRQIASNDQDIKDLQDQIDSIFGFIDGLLDALQRQITSVEYQGVYNRMFGYVSTPTGNSGLMFALYGESVTDGAQAFPKAEASYELLNKLSEADVTMLRIKKDYTIPASGEIIADEEGASAGYIYFSLNPTNVVIDSTNQFALVNGMGEENYILRNIRPTNMPFAYGNNTIRTTELLGDDICENGLYEAEVILPLETIEENAMHFGNFAYALKDVFASLKNGEDVNFRAVSDQLIDLNIQASEKMQLNAVKAIWSNGYEPISVISTYSYGISALKPLTSSFGKSFKLANYLPDFTGLVQEFDPISASSNPDVQAVIEQLNDNFSKANEFFKKISDVINRIYGSSLVNKEIDVETLMQPILLCLDENGDIIPVSTDKNAPTECVIPEDNEVFPLIATSYDTGMLAPSFKKFVGVTDVFSGEKSAQGGEFILSQAALDANSGADFSTVADGAKNIFAFDPQIRDLDNEYIYEIAYSTLDYAGQSMTRKYYIKFVNE